MIARIWHGRTTAKLADDYAPYLEETGLRDYRNTPGNLGVTVLRASSGDAVDFLIISYWESMDAIRAFAGDDVERARYYARDAEFFEERELHVRHFEVASDIRS